MRRWLLASSSLVAASLIAAPSMAQQAAPQKKAAEKLQLGITGYWVMNFVVASQDERGVLPASASSTNFTNQGGTGCGTPPRRRNHSLFNEGEVHFQGETTLDSGLKVGLRVELEASRNAGTATTTATNTANGGAETSGNFDTNIDQVFAWFDGAFGRIDAGQTYGAAFNLQYAGPSPFPNFIQTNNIAPIPAPGNTASGTNAAAIPIYNIGFGIDDRNQKLAYYSPRLFGVQLGLSYSPDGDANARGGNQVDQMSMDNNAGQQSQAFQFGGNFRDKFGGVELGLSAGYLRTSAEPCTNSAFIDCKSTANGVTIDDRRQWALGATVAMAGFTLGGTYRQDNQGLKNPGRDATAWQIGGNYKTGPWTFGAEYIRIEAEQIDATPATAMSKHKDTLDEWAAGAIYNLGPGIDVYGGMIRMRWSNGDSSQAGAAKLAQENDAWLGVLGAKLQF
ncbi:MAG: porin [Alphaproteobacteria bacterium]|nr:porin [Alphaproteobacteria bacterium]